MSFTCPVSDQRFVLDEVVRIAELAQSNRYAEATPDTVDAVLEAAAAFAEGEIAPLNESGDREGARWTDGQVATPAGFRDAYSAFVEGGWMGLSAPVEAGGQGLPLSLSAAVMEDLNAANLAFALCPMLGLGAVEAIRSHGSDALKDLYLPKIVSGEWTATMNLTEPQAGSDVGALKTRAVPAGDGSWRIAGSKIFITFGEHDLAPNIVHLVLARTPNAPEGTRGISLFLVPKVLPGGEINDLKCVSIEHKLGIHASPTCVMSYGENGGATGWLVGDELAGMRGMFTMMNNARLNVGLQGVGIAERATQRAVAYALERKQGQRTGLPAAIAEHPDVRRMLLRMRALTMAARALAYYAFGQADRGELGDRDAMLRADVLTPLVKLWCTDIGCEVASLGVQVHGGMGYVEETGAAQHLRDARIAPIYEGTNGIQAADFVQRKIGLDGGGALDALLADIRAEAEDERLVALVDSVEILVATARNADGDDRLAGSYPLTTMAAVMAAGWLMERMSRAAQSAGDGRRAAIGYFLSAVVPEALGIGASAAIGADLLYSAAAGRSRVGALQQVGGVDAEPVHALADRRPFLVDEPRALRFAQPRPRARRDEQADPALDRYQAFVLESLVGLGDSERVCRLLRGKGAHRRQRVAVLVAAGEDGVGDRLAKSDVNGLFMLGSERHAVVIQQRGNRVNPTAATNGARCGRVRAVAALRDPGPASR